MDRSTSPAVRRAAVAVVAAAILVAVTVVLIAYGAAMDIVHPEREEVAPRPADFGLTAEDVVLRTSDGLSLAAWWLPPTGADRAALVVVPGYGDHRGDAITTTVMLASQGYGVLTFDWRAVGASEGDTATIGYDERRDLVAAFEWLRGRPEVDASRLGGLARSAGAAALVYVAADDPSVRAVVAETTFSALEDMMAMGVRAKTGLPPFPFAPLIVWFGERETGRRIGDVRPVDVVGRISPRPILIIRAGRDEWVPASNADALYAAAGEPKELWDVPGAEHARAHRDDPAGYEARVVGFFDRYLRGAPPVR